MSHPLMNMKHEILRMSVIGTTNNYKIKRMMISLVKSWLEHSLHQMIKTMILRYNK